MGNDSTTLYLCLGFVEDKHRMTLPEPMDGPEAAMYDMHEARSLAMQSNAPA